MTVPVRQPITSDIMESVLLKGDLAKLTPDERVRYYNEVCRSLGLNPLTQPFAYITLNGKLQLYALRACADQLRKVNSVSLEIVSQEVANDILTVRVRATLPDGRQDEDLGTVFFPDLLRGEARANAELKAVTKAKRRATLSICGLGWLDETEIDSVPGGRRPKPPAANVMIGHDPETGEIADPPAVTAPGAAEPAPPSTDTSGGGAGEVTTWQEYTERWDAMLEEAGKGYGRDLLTTWNSAAHKKLRREIDCPEGALEELMDRVSMKAKELG